MEFVQKKRGHKHSFTFHDNHFYFAYEDKAGSGDTDIRYADFPLKHSIKIRQNEWYGEINFENPLDNEIHKFKWLQEQAVISQEECDKKIAQLELEKNKLLEVTPTLPN